MEDTYAEHRKTPAQEHEGSHIAPSHGHDEQKAHIATAQEHGGEKHDEQKVHTNPSHEHGEHQPHAEKKKFDFFRWLKGNSRQEYLENASYALIIAAAIMVGIGVSLGTFVRYTIYVGAFGALLVLVGIVLYIVSQLTAPEKETGQVKA